MRRLAQVVESALLAAVPAVRARQPVQLAPAPPLPPLPPSPYDGYGQPYPAQPTLPYTAPSRFAAVAELLGARARPFDLTDAGDVADPTPSESWALIAARLPGGWTPLAEAYSRDSGVVLAFSIAYDLERYAGQRGEFVEVHASGPVEVFLEEELPNAARCGEEVECTSDHTVGGRRMRSILQRPTAGASRVAWDGVRLGDGSGLRAMVGLADGVRAGSDGVVFEVRVDGELVHAQRAEPEGPWRLLQVDLRPFAGRSVELELAVEPGSGANGDWALWGRPMLVHGFAGPSSERDGAGR